MDVVGLVEGAMVMDIPPLVPRVRGSGRWRAAALLMTHDIVETLGDGSAGVSTNAGRGDVVIWPITFCLVVPGR